jgi:hypothetical protein
MLGAMSQRRLPLIQPEPASLETPAFVMQHLPGQVLVVGDAGDGLAALRWAAQLTGHLRDLGRMPALGLVGAEAAQVRTLFPPQLALQEVPGVVLLGAAPLALDLPDSQLLVLAGPWALLAFRGRLNVLVSADTPVLRWPEALRALRGTFDLELAGDGLSMTSALASSMSAG